MIASAALASVVVDVSPKSAYPCRHFFHIRVSLTSIFPAYRMVPHSPWANGDRDAYPASGKGFLAEFFRMLRKRNANGQEADRHHPTRLEGEVRATGADACPCTRRTPYVARRTWA